MFTHEIGNLFLLSDRLLYDHVKFITAIETFYYDDFLDFLNVVLDIPENERREFFQKITKFLKHSKILYNSNIEFAIQLVKTLPKGFWFEENANIAIGELLNSYNPNSVAWWTQLLPLIPLEARRSLVNLYPSLLLLPLDEIEEVNGRLLAARDDDWRIEDDFFFILSNPPWREKALAALKERLASPLEPRMMFSVCMLVVNYAALLGLSEDDPIVQDAIEKATLCDVDELKNPKHPLRIYKFLRDEVPKEPYADVELTGEMIEGERVKWNLETLRAKGEWEGYTFRDLPDVPRDTFKNIFDSLERRLTPELEEEIKGYTENVPLQELRKGFLDTVTIQGLLQREGKEDDPLDAAQLHLFSLMKSLSETENVIPPDGGLSDREKAAVMMAASIQMCSTGLKRGLNSTYRSLKPEYWKRMMAGEDQIGLATSDVDECVQHALSLTLLESKLMEEVTGLKEVEQGVHQSEYLANRLARQIGLREKLSLDIHTGVLAGEIANRDVKTLMQSFFRFCPPSRAVNALVSASPELIKKQSYGLIQLIRKGLGVVEVKDLERYLVADDDGIPLQLTRAGALAALKGAGYFIS